MVGLFSLLFSRRFFRFGLVGFLGALVSLLVARLVFVFMYAVVRVGKIEAGEVGVSVGFLASVVFNFVLHEFFTFGSRFGGRWWLRFLGFFGSSVFSWFWQGFCVWLLFGFLGIFGFSLSQFVGILLGFLFNYLVSSYCVWRGFSSSLHVA